MIDKLVYFGIVKVGRVGGVNWETVMWSIAICLLLSILAIMAGGGFSSGYLLRSILRYEATEGTDLAAIGVALWLVGLGVWIDTLVYVSLPPYLLTSVDRWLHTTELYLLWVNITMGAIGWIFHRRDAYA